MSTDLGGGFVAYELHEWGGTSAGRPFLGRVGREWLHHSVTIATANAFGDFRTLDGIGRSRGHRGVSYSELIHPDGTVGIGQGDRVGAHTGGHNSTSRGVVIICNCDQQIPTDRAIEAYRRLREWKIRTGRLAPGTYPTGGHRDTGFATACPGANNYARLGLFRAGAGPVTPTPAPPPPISTHSGDLGMDAIFHNNIWHFFHARDDGALIEREFDGQGNPIPTRPEAVIMPPGWCRIGAGARVKVLDPAPNADPAYGYAVSAVREDGKHVNVAFWNNTRWTLRGWPS